MTAVGWRLFVPVCESIQAQYYVRCLEQAAQGRFLTLNLEGSKPAHKRAKNMTLHVLVGDSLYGCVIAAVALGS